MARPPMPSLDPNDKWGAIVTAAINTLSDRIDSLTTAVNNLSNTPIVDLGVKAQAGNAQVALNWTALPNATSYTVVRQGADANGFNPETLSTPSNSITDTGLVNGTNYTYTVTSVPAGGAGTVTATPLAPASSTVYLSVTAGGQSRNLDGTNVARDVNQLILYPTGTDTGTNQYGVEVQVSAAGKIIAVNNRINSGSTTATPIPAGGYVLSGHGQGTGYAGQWLLDNASTVGATVTLSTSTVTPPTPPPTTSGKTFNIWHNTFTGPALSAWPSDVKTYANMCSLGIAQSAGNGAVSYSSQNGQSNAAHAADIAAFQSAGGKVLMGFGGASDTTAITNATQVTNFVNSIKSLQSTFGFSGIDIDLEPSGSSWNQTSLVSAVQQLKSWNPNFIIGCTPGLYGSYTAQWFALAQALLPNNLDFMAPMLYDFPESTDSRLTQICLDRTQSMLDAGIPISKIMLGFATQDPSDTTASPPSVSLAALQAVKQKYPDLKGCFLWEDGIENRGGSAGTPWAASRKLGPLARS